MAEPGARAIREFTALLESNPTDLNARWLLNIAYMALGQHPKSVPASWLIAPETFDSEYDVKRDIAPAVGLNLTGHAGGSIAEDFDGDGFIDLMISSQGPMDQLRYFHNNGDGTFAERTNEAGLLGETGGLNLIHADYNNDGRTSWYCGAAGWVSTANIPFLCFLTTARALLTMLRKTLDYFRRTPTQTAASRSMSNTTPPSHETSTGSHRQPKASSSPCVSTNRTKP